jgi:hypothetical protein
MRAVSIALVHFPVLDGKRAEVTTTVTNLDVHDLARSARTFGCSSYFVVHPVEAQRTLVGRIQEHWTTGSSAQRIPTRKVALALLRVVPSLEAMVASLGGRDAVELWATAARSTRAPLAFAEARARLRTPGKPVIILFGTGWGLAPAVVDAVDALLPAIQRAPGVGEGDPYNHLSVRAACAITLDRLLGA